MRLVVWMLKEGVKRGNLFRFVKFREIILFDLLFQLWADQSLFRIQVIVVKWHFPPFRVAVVRSEHSLTLLSNALASWNGCEDENPFPIPTSVVRLGEE